MRHLFFLIGVPSILLGILDLSFAFRDALGGGYIQFASVRQSWGRFMPSTSSMPDFVQNAVSWSQYQTSFVFFIGIGLLFLLLGLFFSRNKN
ncbi:MAG: hypothetical protein HRU28_14220 [Rhizobiales bacterium]|nr:hypothetical protein [Hyphomicrobiales bacterium]